MKISSSIEKLYNDKLDSYNFLKKYADNVIPSLIQDTWHYDGRVKALESFAQKVETSRFTQEEIYHDLFACRIVVDNITEISNIVDIIKGKFVFIKAMPASSSQTHKKPEEFPFDDLRLYCRWTDEIKKPEDEVLKDLIFEIQIKTYLQHAWGISTHSMIYKGNDVNWKLNRIAYQIKAILEHVELSIGNAEELAKTTLLPTGSFEYKKLKRLHIIITTFWDEENIPEDITRLVQNIMKILKDIEMNLGEYQNLLKKNAVKGKITIRNLSPYYATLQLLNDFEEDKLIKFIKANDKFLPISELELNENVNRILYPEK